MIDAEYVLPLRWADDRGLDELVGYLRVLSGWIDVTVVDGSGPDRFSAHAAALPAGVRHLPVQPWPGRNGKVAGVVTGVRAARHERVVIADDDVRYREDALGALVGRLDDADVVAPQNHFAPLPWHARWDTGRILLNRALAHDFPGTLAVRRSRLAEHGYDGDVLFENLELLRTVAAAGGRVVAADDLYVERRPPTFRHFAGQRVRQAYDSLAQPVRLAAELLILPVVLLGLLRSRRSLLALAVAAVALAEAGRRRAGGCRVFPPSSALWAPAWLLERGVCAWAAVVQRARGGVRYSDGRLARAGTPLRVLRNKHRNEPRSEHRNGSRAST
ncbi:glycosyltransferase [Leifsonia sp. NPDC080035]|uniref:Glycosyltransferase n=1 Tax=Leifsonia sp. NPDC080035 TaxID=3143936 RepID=A0AAU7G9U0_9MICO